MPRIPKDLEALELKGFLKTNRRFSIVDTLDAARVIDEKNHSYKNKSRLYRDIAEGCKDALDQIHKLIGMIPAQYSKEILQTDAVTTFRLMTLDALLQANYARKPFNQKEFDHYSNLLDESIRGIALMMPDQFGPLINPHTDSLRIALRCFSEFGKAYHLEKKIPNYGKPHTTPESNPVKS